jgi:diguanylate cyclase (GGDEF)-like protein/PAS domain S-box-containing protein
MPRRQVDVLFQRVRSEQMIADFRGMTVPPAIYGIPLPTDAIIRPGDKLERPCWDKMLGAEIIAFLEAYPMAALVVDATGMVVFANPKAQDLFALAGAPSELAISDLMPDWPLITDVAQPLIVAGNGRQRNCQVRIMSWRSASDVLTAVLIDSEGEDRHAAVEAREANLRLRYVIEMLPEAVCVFDASDRYVLWNEKYAELYPDIADHLKPGIAFEDILKISLSSGRMPEVVEDKDLWLQQRMRKFHQPVSQEEQQLQDGRWLRHDDRRTPDGGAIGMRIDISALKQREERLRQLFDANPMPMLLCDGSSLEILQANRAAIDFYGFVKATLLSKRACDMHVESEADRFAAALLELKDDCEARTVWRQRVADGTERHVLVYVRMLHEGLERRLLLTVADVSDRILAEAEANRLARHDMLTGLPNRMCFYKSLDEALKVNNGKDIAVFCLDLDGFKPVNDTFGHAAGDEILKMVAERLRGAARGHMVARLGGDEFAILMVGGVEDIADVAKGCIAAFKSSFRIEGATVDIGISIGVSSAPENGQDGEALVQEADRALYRAKANGRNTWRTASNGGRHQIVSRRAR